MSAISTIAGDGHRRECDQAGRAGPRARSHDRPRSDQHGHGGEADEDQVLDRRLRGRDLGDGEAERYRDQGSTHEPEPLASRLPGRRVSSRELKEVPRMARKTVFVSDLTGKEIADKNAATVTIAYADARKGIVKLDVNAAEVADLAATPRAASAGGYRPPI